jgi:Metallopeptidase family M24
MIRPGVGEQELSGDIHELAAEMFGVTRHWHRRIVRAGENTLQPFQERPPDRVIADNDIVFLDLGPIFEDWEADFGRTFVLSDDPDKKAVRDALPRVWQAGRDYFDNHPDVTGAELFDFVLGSITRRVSSSAVPSPVIWSASSRTRKSPVLASSGTSCPGRTSRCDARTQAADCATGSSKSIWSIVAAASAVSTSSCSTCPEPHRTLRLGQCARLAPSPLRGWRHPHRGLHRHRPRPCTRHRRVLRMTLALATSEC